MVEPLTKIQVARLLKALCEKHQCSPQSVIREIRDDGVPISDNSILAYLDGVYYLRNVHTVYEARFSELCHRYAIFIDDVPRYSHPSGVRALWFCSKLTQLLFLAKEIRLVDTYNDSTLRTWVAHKDIIGGWVCT